MKPTKSTSVLIGSLALGLSLATLKADVRQGLVAYWPLDTVSDTTPDLVYTNNLTLTNMDSSSLVPGRFGSALAFNGTNQCLLIYHPENNADCGLPIYSATRYSIGFWVQANSGQASKVLVGSGATATSSSPSAALLLLSTPTDGSAKLSILVRDTKGVVQLNALSAATVFDGQWHHITWTDDNGQATLYVDGAVDSTFSYTPSSLLLNITSVGGLLPASFFTGTLDEVEMWERAITQSEVQDVMTNGIATPIPAFAPGANQQPTNYVTTVGDRARFSVVPTGTRPLNFQWNANSNPKAGATSATLSMLGVTLADAGTYNVTITNTAGFYSSSNATLTVNSDPPPAITNGLVSYWPLDLGTNGTTPDLREANDLTLHNIAASDFVAGQYSNSVYLNGINAYANRTKGVQFYSTSGYSIAFWVNGYPGQASGEIFTEASSVDGAPLFMIGTPVSGSSPGNLDVFLRDSSGTYRLNHVLSTNIVFDTTWHHVALVDVNGLAKVYIDGALDAADFTYTPGTTTCNTTALGGLLRAVPSNFFFGNVDDLAIWNRGLTLTEVQEVMSNGLASVVTPSGPVITSQPSDAVVTVGSDYTLNVQVLGGPPLSYQWFKDSNPIANATNSSLSLFFVQPSDSGGYSAVISNSVSSVTSRTAAITTQPASIPYVTNVTNGLVSYWPMDVITNGVTPDVINGNDLTLVNMVASNLVTGVRGSAFAFNGTSQYLRRIHSTSPSVGLPIYLNNTYTISMWVKGAAGQVAKEVFSEANTTNATPLFMVGTLASANTNGFADLFIRNSANATVVGHKASTNELFNNSWHHLAMTDSNGVVVMYIDGVAQSAIFNYTKAALNANDTVVGGILRTTAGSFFAGQIDEVAVWSRILQPQEVQFVMANNPIAPGLRIASVTKPSAATAHLNILTPHSDWPHVIQETPTVSPVTWTNLSGVSFVPTGANLLQADVPAGNSQDFYRAALGIPNAYFTDTLESANPQWAHSGTGDTWVLGTPAIGPQRAHSGTTCWATSLATPYGPNTSMHLRSPAIDLTQVNNAWLTFYEFRDIQALVSNQIVDSATVNILDANNPDGAPLDVVALNVGSESNWTRRVFPLSAAVVGKQIMIEFVFTSGATQSGSHTGWFIDDISVAPQPF